MIRWLEKKRFVSLILTILIAIEIFAFSSLQGAPGIAAGNIWIPRAYHFIVFFLFSFFLLATIKGTKKLKLSHLLIILIISIAHGILDEIHQAFIPFRDASIRDVLTNTIGIFLAVILYSYMGRKINKLTMRKRKR